jgi:hypothetical protein
MLELDWLWLADWQAIRITPIPPANANLNRFIDLSLQDCAHLISHFAVYSTHLTEFGVFFAAVSRVIQGTLHSTFHRAFRYAFHYALQDAD